MVNEESKRILDNSYADSLREVVDYIVLHDEYAKAKELTSVLFKAASDNMAELKLKPQLLSFYEETMRKLKFIGLPLLENNEVIDLIKNNFCFQFKIDNYDLLQKIEAKLLNIIVVDERNKLKEDLRRVLVENSEKIVANHDTKLIKDWLKNYVSKVGLDSSDKLAKTQYLVALKNDKQISPAEYNNLLTLFNFYDRLNLTSDTPEGFEEEPPILIKGKLYIFRKGIMEEVLENPNIAAAMQLAGEAPAVEDRTPTAPVSSQPAPISPQAAPATPPPTTLAELESILKDYSESSLEHKAISQEISRFKRSELKKSQKADVKK